MKGVTAKELQVNIQTMWDDFLQTNVLVIGGFNKCNYASIKIECHNFYFYVSVNYMT